MGDDKRAWSVTERGPRIRIYRDGDDLNAVFVVVPVERAHQAERERDREAAVAVASEAELFKRAEKAEARIQVLEEALRSVECNDKTVYVYTGPMSLNRDGRKADSGRWATPRELARDALASEGTPEDCAAAAHLRKRADALQSALDDLVDTTGRVGYDGRAGAVEDLEDARREAIAVLRAEGTPEEPVAKCLLIAATRVDSQSPVTVTVEAHCGHRAQWTAWTVEEACREAEAKLAVPPAPRDPDGQTVDSSPAAEPSTLVASEETS